jgi:hypothetical protein
MISLQWPSQPFFSHRLVWCNLLVLIFCFFSITGPYYYYYYSCCCCSLPPHVSYGLRAFRFRSWPKRNWLGMPMRRSYVVPMRWMVICEYEVPGGALNLDSSKLPRPWLPWESSPSRKNPHGRTGNRTQYLMISSKKLWPLDHKAGHVLSRKFGNFVWIWSVDEFLVL